MAGSLKILIVDDEPSNIALMEQDLEDLGYQTISAVSGEEAVGILQRENADNMFPGIVVTDIKMPGMGGLELMKQTLKRDSELPVVLVTAHGDVAMAVDAMRDGAYDFIEKPIDLQRLTDAVHRAIEKRRLVLELRTLRAGWIAFMAMPFDDPLLDRVYAVFKKAVRETGFELRRIDENAPAGPITNRLLAEIRRSRFLIAELTNDNSGAYWEAGFATGVDRPVIYTCEKSYFLEIGTHFDTKDHLTVIWEKDRLDIAAEQLKTTIRATLPDEAVQGNSAN